jgi:TolB protein
MLRQQEFTNRLAAFAHRSVAVALLTGIAACADTAAPTRMMEPASASFGKNVTGSNQRLLFASMRDGNEELYSINPDGTGLTRLTYDPAGDAYAVWSPDGKRIAFTSWRDNPLGEIYTMNADGTGVVRLTNSPGSSQQPTWSKDGKQLAFVSNRTAANPASYNENDFEIYVMNADGTGVTRITTNAFSEMGPVWSPDGKQIAFVSNRDNLYWNDLYVMGVDGTLVTRLTQTDGSTKVYYPAWEPHGRNIAYQTAQGIFTVDPATRHTTQLTTVSALPDVNPSYSSDGSQIAFASWRDGNLEVYTMNADGTQQTRLTNNAALDFLVRWSR